MQVVQLFGQYFDQLCRFGCRRNGIANLSPDMDRTRERAQVQPDNGAFQPGLDFGNDFSVIAGWRSKHDLTAQYNRSIAMVAVFGGTVRGKGDRPTTPFSSGKSLDATGWRAMDRLFLRSH
jgi:hypothetical protein